MFERIQSMVGGCISMVRGFTVAPLRGLLQGRLFVQADGTTDLSRVLGAVSILGYLFLQGWALIALKQTFDAGAFGGGLSAVCGGAGVFILAHNYASK